METNKINTLFNLGANATYGIVFQPDGLQEFCKKLIKDTIEELGVKNESNKTESYLTINEAAELFRITRGTLNRWHNEGILRHNEIGGRRFYKKSEIDAYRKGERK